MAGVVTGRPAPSFRGALLREPGIQAAVRDGRPSGFRVRAKEDARPGMTARERLPSIERLPVLRISWKTPAAIALAPPTKPLTELNYRDNEYLIADPLEAAVEENDYWNRDVFRLIGALTAQVTVDISKFPIANISQLNSQ